jgi:hypothetical protein
VKGQRLRFIHGHHGRGSNAVRHLADGTSVITLERKQGPNLECVIDTADYDAVKNFRWWARKDRRTFYAVSTLADNRKERMHRLLLGNSEKADHIDHNGLNNKRSNLRPATEVQNSQNRQKREGKNTSKFKGVCCIKQTGHFKASIGLKGTKINLGYFEAEEGAARAYDEAAIKFYGEFACLNFPREIAA